MDPTTGLLTNLLTSFTTVFSAGYAKVLPDAQSLLSILATLEIAFMGIWWALDGGQRIEASLFRKVLQIGFFVWIVDNYKVITETVLKGFISVGLKAGGSSWSNGSILTDPSLIIDYGFTVTDPVFAYIRDYTGIKIHLVLLAAIAALLIVLSYFAIAMAVFITYVEFYFVSVLGLILVPFGVFKHTSFLSEKVFGAIVAFGIRLMVMAFILTLTEPTMKQITLATGEPDIKKLLLVVLTAFTIAVLSWHAPGIASGLMAGAPALGVGTVAGTALALGAGAAAVGATGMSAATGIASAVRAGVEKTRSAAAGGGDGIGPHGTSTASSSSNNGGGGLYQGAKQASKTRNGRGPDAGGGVGGPPSTQSSMPVWAQGLMMARMAVPSDSHPTSGMSVPLGRT